MSDPRVGKRKSAALKQGSAIAKRLLKQESRGRNATSVVLVGSSYAPFVSRLETGVSWPLDVYVAATPAEEDVRHLIADAEVVVSSYWTEAMARVANRLRFLQVPGAGWDKIDPNAIRPGVLVANCYGHEWAMAEYVMMVCLAMARDLLQADRALRENRWDYHFATGHPLCSELGDLTIGIIGLGRIGRTVARLANAFKMTTIAIDIRIPTPAQARAIPVSWVGRPHDLKTLLGQSDFVLLSLPLNDQTRGMLGEEELSWFRPGASLINVARAELLEEKALFDALKSGRLRAAALDPWWRYPVNGERVAPAKMPFHELGNLIMTPHYSGSTVQTVERRMKVIAENIDRFLSGRPVKNVVLELSRTPQLKDGWAQ